MNRESKIYVAGHRGMVGSAIVDRLRRDGYENIVVRSHGELDLRRQADVEQFFATERPDYVFLAAAKVGGILANNTYKAEFIHDNLAIAVNVIETSYRSGVRKLLNLGSSCIYPKFAPQPLQEDHLLTGALEPTNEPYAIAKIAAIKLCRYYNEQYGTDYISLMPTNLYGPHDNFNLETAHVLPALIRKFHLAKLVSERDEEVLLADVQRYPIGFDIDVRSIDAVVESLQNLGISGDVVRLWGSGTPYREFLHVHDLAAASVLAMREFSHEQLGELVNVGTGVDSTISEIASMVREVVGFEGGIDFDRSKPDGTPRKLMNVDRLAELGWRASIDFREGIENTYDWYRRSIEQTVGAG